LGNFSKSEELEVRISKIILSHWSLNLGFHKKLKSVEFELGISNKS
jgi:hypothetical protein